jgi:futalosine hydrolase
MRILFVAAVDFELEAARAAWEGFPADYLLGGWGAGSTRPALEQQFSGGATYDLVINVGIAGGRPGGPAIGDVVHVISERFGEQPGFLLRQPAPCQALAFLPVAAGNTVQQLDDRFRQVEYDVETMEGAAFFAFCLQQGCAFAEIRAVSNVVGERDHARWNIPLALQNLQSALRTFRNNLSHTPLSF